MMTEIKALVNRCFRAAGYQVVPYNVASLARKAADIFPRQKILIEELGAFLKETVFPDLEVRPGRTEAMAELIGTGPTEGFYIVAHLNRCLKLDGDICEFGVAQGATSALIANEIRNSQKKFWLFDSFEGLPKPTDKDVLIDDIFNLGSMEKYQGTMANPESSVRARLNKIKFPMERTKIVKGFVEKTIKQNAVPSKVAFAYLDFDFYEPIKITLEFLNDRIPQGGVVIVDDYGHFSEGAQVAVDEFIVANSEMWKCEVPPKYAGAFAVLTKK